MLQAPTLPNTTNLIHRFELGAFTITQLSDGGVEHHDAHGFFGTNTDAETFETFSRACGLSTDVFDFPATVTLIEKGTHRILVDAGHGAPSASSHTGGAGRLCDALAQADVAPDSITQVLISHLHADHIGGLLTRYGEPAFANAHHRLNPVEAAYWTGKAAGTPMGQAAKETLRVLSDLVDDVRPGQTLIPGVDLVESSGHTPGHMSVRVDGGKRQCLFISSDLANHPVWSIAQPDWHMHLDVDPLRAARTRSRLLGWVADEGMLMAGYHMPFPGLGHVRRTGSSFAYVPVD